jgi:phosphonate transport system ATP-binding protein
MAGFLKPERGNLTVLGEPMRGRAPPALRRRLGYIPQQLGLVRSLTALENAMMGSLARVGNLRSLLGLIPAKEREAALGWLDRLGIADKAEERAFRLSGGQRQRVAIARTLVQRPSIIFADEFVSDLDMTTAADIVGLAKRIGQEQGITFVVTMHEPALVEAFATDVVVVRDGRVERGEGPVFAGVAE